MAEFAASCFCFHSSSLTLSTPPKKPESAPETCVSICETRAAAVLSAVSTDAYAAKRFLAAAYPAPESPSSPTSPLMASTRDLASSHRSPMPLSLPSICPVTAFGLISIPTSASSVLRMGGIVHKRSHASGYPVVAGVK